MPAQVPDLERQENLATVSTISCGSRQESITPLYGQISSKPSFNNPWDKIKIMILVGLVPISALALVVLGTYLMAGDMMHGTDSIYFPKPVQNNNSVSTDDTGGGMIASLA